jgi:FtsZ-binding cell division protein ZapB
MKAVKANRVYTITEAEQKSFINQGYDIYDDHGNCVAYGAGKTVPYGKYKKALDHIALLEVEIGDLRKEIATLMAEAAAKTSSKSKSKAKVKEAQADSAQE